MGMLLNPFMVTPGIVTPVTRSGAGLAEGTGWLDNGAPVARYWKIEFSNNLSDPDYLHVIQIEMIAAGVRVDGDATITASSAESGFPASNLSNGDVYDTGSNGWKTALSPSYPQSLVYDFGSPIEIQHINLHRPEVFETGYAEFVILCSNDGTNWTAYTSASLYGGSSNSMDYLDLTYGYTGWFLGSKRYWRFPIWANNGWPYYYVVTEIEMRLTTGGANQCVGGTASASSINGALTPASKAFDGDVSGSGAWVSGGIGLQWLQYDFGSAKAITEVEVISYIGSDGEADPRDFAIQCSDSPTGPWITVEKLMGYVLLSGASVTYTDSRVY